MAKSSKSHPTDSDAGVRTSESGVGRLRGFASKPSPPLALPATRPLSRHRNQVGDQPCGKKRPTFAGETKGAYIRVRRATVIIIHIAASGGTINPHSRSTRKKRMRRAARQSRGGAKAPILRAPGSAAGRILPRKTTCGGFWYFWPQKYKGKTLFFFSAFRWRKAAKATRPIPMAASGRLKAASGDCSRVCKQTVPSACAFSRPSAFPPSEPSREFPCEKNRKK